MLLGLNDPTLKKSHILVNVYLIAVAICDKPATIYTTFFVQAAASLYPKLKSSWYEDACDWSQHLSELCSVNNKPFAQKQLLSEKEKFKIV